MEGRESLEFVVEQLEGYASTLKSHFSTSLEMDNQIDEEKDKAIDLVKEWFYKQ